MKLDIIGDGDHIEITPALRQMIEEKLNHKVLHKLSNVTHVKIILKVHKDEQSAEGFVHYGHNEIFAHSVSQDMYKSIDLLIDKLTKQAVKLKEKMKDHHGTHGHDENMFNEQKN